jgi:hypothetical protein
MPVRKRWVLALYTHPAAPCRRHVDERATCYCAVYGCPRAGQEVVSLALLLTAAPVPRAETELAHGAKLETETEFCAPELFRAYWKVVLGVKFSMLNPRLHAGRRDLVRFGI